MLSPYSPYSFTPQSPDCSGTFSSGCLNLSVTPMATISSRCHHKDFPLDFSSPSSFPAGIQSCLEGAYALISDLVGYILAFFSLFEVAPPPA